MNPIDAIQRLEAAARAEPTPHIDVTAGVLSAISRGQADAPAPIPIHLLLLAQVSAAAAAVIVSALAWAAWVSASDPMQAFFDALEIGL